VQLKEGATRLQAEEQLRAVNQKYLPAWSDDLKKEGALPDKQGDVFNTHLMSFDKVHLHRG
jgi:hypothetical protein